MGFLEIILHFHFRQKYLFFEQNFSYAKEKGKCGYHGLFKKPGRFRSFIKSTGER
jgi:hypothetical protein